MFLYICTGIQLCLSHIRNVLEVISLYWFTEPFTSLSDELKENNKKR